MKTIDEVLEELKKREPIFHREEFGRTRSDFDTMMDKDFWEVGASGHKYSKNLILDTLEDRYSRPYDENWQTMDFKCQKISQDVYLLTYTLRQENNRLTQRSTLWKNENNADWKIMYHQGTIIQKSQTP